MFIEIISLLKSIKFGEAGSPAKQFTYHKKEVYPIAAVNS